MWIEGEPTGEVNGVCWKLMGALAGVIVCMATAIVKLARFAWDERMARLNDHIAAQEQINVAKNAARQKGGHSP